MVIISARITFLQSAMPKGVEFDQGLHKSAPNISLGARGDFQRLNDISTAVQQVTIIFHG